MSFTMIKSAIICSYCSKPISVKTRLCPHCGGENIKKQKRKFPLCPHCQNQLEKYDYRSTKLNKCSQCSGLWINVRDFKLLTSERDVFRDDDVSPHFVRKPFQRAEKYLSCARCSVLMNRINFKNISTVMIDYCRDCGFWLDAGELKQIRSFIASGGLEQAQDRKLAQHAERIGSLNRRVGDLEFMQKMLHLWKFKRWIFQGF